MAICPIEQWEIESILADELRRSNLAKEVSVSATDKDFNISGTFNIVGRVQQHYAGLGAIIYAPSLLPVLLLPARSIGVKCEIMLEITPGKGDGVIFSKSYYEEYSSTQWLYNIQEPEQAAGSYVIPKIINQFVEDVRRIPASAWSAQ